MRFPDGFGDLGGKTFQEVFDTHPKWIECVRATWTENCTGLFLEFYNYVHATLKIPHELENHEIRCMEYVKDNNPSDLPKYLLNYLNVSLGHQNSCGLPDI